MIKYNKTNDAFKFTLNKEEILKSTFKITDKNFRSMLAYGYGFIPNCNIKLESTMTQLLHAIGNDMENSILNAEYEFDEEETIDDMVASSAGNQKAPKDYTQPFADLQELLNEVYIVVYEEVKEKIAKGEDIDYNTLIMYMTDKERIGQVFYTKEDDQIVAFKITNTEHVQTQFSNYLRIEGAVNISVDDCISKGVHKKMIGPYKGGKSFSTLSLNPMTPEVEKILVERGTKYVSLVSKPAYMQYSGNLVRRNWFGDQHFRSDGRIMVDKTTMKKIDPNYGTYFGLDRWRDKEANNAPFDSEFSDEELSLMVPFVYGFSFVSKQWGEFIVDDVAEIEFRDQAYDQLVLEESKKEMISALVETNDQGKDIISGKGGGLIFLLDGTPGVGKTLTAEAIAEKLRKPLYIVGAGELGTSPTQLETNLRNILDTAHFWDAVLLIDEADIFLEARSHNDILRNAMVGIFLRMLEYYQGILFLTTNRADSIDDAFFSRISLSMHYDGLDEAKRTQIWRNVLGLYEVVIAEGDLAKLGNHDINGRQIKNCVRLAHSLATSKQRVLAYDDIDQVINTINDFKTAVANKGKTPVQAAAGFLIQQ